MIAGVPRNVFVFGKHVEPLVLAGVGFSLPGFGLGWHQHMFNCVSVVCLSVCLCAHVHACTHVP